MRSLRPFVAVFVVLLGAAAQALAQGYTSVVVFGDSLSDTGNVARLTQSQFLTRIPGPIADYTDGRFTDGLDTLPAAKTYTGVWVEQLASQFAAKPTIKSSLDGGTDYAYGFATTANGTTVNSFAPAVPISIVVNNMGQQVTDYLATSPTLNASTLFIVWGGANDLNAAQTSATPTADIMAAAAREVALVQRLIAAGATDILVPNLPPLGLIPRFNGSATLAAQATQGALGFNQALAAGLASLPAANSGRTLRIYTLDTFALFSSIVGPPPTGGITNVTASSQGNATVNPDNYLFWDDLHPTTTGHHLIALAATRLLSATPVPTATALTSSNLNANLASSVTLTATVTPGSGTVAPTGTVTFRDGSTVLGTSPVTGSSVGLATYTTTGLKAGSHSLTASFSGVNGFASSTSTTVAQIITAPAVNASLSPSSVSVLSAGTAGTTLSVTGVGGFSGTVSFACGTLPAHFLCQFSPATVNLTSAAPQAVATLNVGTAAGSAALLHGAQQNGTLTWAFLGVPFAGLLGLLGLRRQGRSRSLPHLLLLGFVVMGAAAAVTGCTSQGVSATPGTYVVPVSVTAGGSTSTVTLTVLVQ